MQANTIHLEERSNISTAARQATGGNITIKSSDLLHLRESEMTTSVATGKGSGGNITITNPTFVVMNGSRIIAQADAGHGGDIYIKSDQFIKSPCSLVSASSRLGIDGFVHIESPDVDMNAFMVILAGGYVEAQLGKCMVKEIENPSTFKIDLTRDRTVPFGKFMKLK
ncbi:filamentous haemagglutinin-like protein [Beggiatoa sp. SS]|nr:filamentous haemagglutinin-like protein [Beggiatoa sp. SS]